MEAATPAARGSIRALQGEQNILAPLQRGFSLSRGSHQNRRGRRGRDCCRSYSSTSTVTTCPQSTHWNVLSSGWARNLGKMRASTISPEHWGQQGGFVSSSFDISPQHPLQLGNSPIRPEALRCTSGFGPGGAGENAIPVKIADSCGPPTEAMSLSASLAFECCHELSKDSASRHLGRTFGRVLAASQPNAHRLAVLENLPLPTP